MTATDEIINRLEKAKEPIKAYLSLGYTSVSDVVSENTSIENEPVIQPTDNVTNHFEPILNKKRGGIYRIIKPYSHYKDPIVSNENYRGRSRVWADADLEVQERVVEDFVKIMRSEPFKRRSPTPQYNGKTETLDERFISLCIAIMRIESGFNLDAAAGTTSAASLGQFVKGTRTAYGIGKSNLWDFNANARALINHTLDNRDYARKKGQGEEYIYAYHHDGPSLAYDGLKLSVEKVMPMISKIQPLVRSFKG